MKSMIQVDFHRLKVQSYAACRPGATLGGRVGWIPDLSHYHESLTDLSFPDTAQFVH